MSTNSKTAFADLSTLIENSIKKKAGKQVGTADNALLLIIREHADRAIAIAEEERRVLLAKIEDLRYELKSTACYTCGTLASEWRKCCHQHQSLR
jgi:hypothetical protein